MDTVKEGLSLDKTTLKLLVRQIRFEGKGINSYELVDPEGADLPAFDAGAHIDIYVGDGLIRQYSLCNPPGDRKRYVIAVLRDEGGRGGSKAVHDRIRVQDVVKISVPRNHFELNRDAKKVILIAGGIGVTPLKAMAHELEASGIDFEMHYCAKDLAYAAFTAELEGLRERGKLQYHFDGGQPGAGLDIGRLLSEPVSGAHVYYCGPSGFMKACAEASAHWPAGSVHFEHFKAPVRPINETEASDAAGDFNVRIASSGQVIPVKRDQSINDALSAAGVLIETSCCAGLCATCKVRYLEGEVEHNDFILSDEEKAEYLTTCVSRATSKELVLDL